jgi:lipopolysaccharide heptosyltransferase II
MKSLIPENIKNILLIRFGSLGDVVLTTPVIGAVRESFPNAYIAMLVGEKSADILSADSRLDEIIIFHRDAKGIKGLEEMRKVVDLLKERNFDVSVDMQRKFRSAYMAYMGKVKYRIGYHQPNAILCDVKIPDKVNKHAVDRNLDLVKTLGIDGVSREPKMYVSDDDRNFALRMFEANGLTSGEPILGIFPGAGWRPRCWMPERFAVIADLAVQHNNARVVIFGGPGECDIVDNVAKNMKSKPILMKEKVTLRQLAGMIERCDIMLSNDTGPMHISVAMGTKTVALFGPGNHIKFQPIGEKHATVRHDIPCSPCKQFTDKCKENICMKLITVDEVWEAVHQRLNRK